MKYLIEALGAWGVPVSVLIILGVIFILMQISGEIIEWTGKVSPKILKLRKVFKERKMKKIKQKEQLDKIENLDFDKLTSDISNINQLITQVQSTLDQVNSHYSADNITQRNLWMQQVNENMQWTRQRAQVYDASVQDLIGLKDSTDKLTEFNCKQIKENYRNRILDFQHRIINAKGKSEPEIFSYEEFAKIYATYDDYEEFLAYTDDVNHQVDNAMETIKKAERGEMPNITFVN